MRAASTLTAIGAALWLAASSAHGMGFGRVSNATQLGQPLNFAASVLMEGDESLSGECVSAEVVSGENKLQAGQVRVTLEGSADSPERSVRVTTSALIDEPVVTVSVTLGCAAKVTRRFVAFVDPPLINLAQAAPAETLPPQRVDSQVAPIVSVVQGDKAVVAPRRAERAPALRSSRNRAPVPPTRASGPRPAVVASAAPRAAKPPAPRRAAGETRQAAAPRAAASGPRLELAAAPTASARGASAPEVIATPAAVAEAASASARAEQQALQLARERQRIQVLEEGLASLRGDSQTTQKSLATLQARLKEAESERYANPLVYALAWLSALLALAVAGLWWRQSRRRGAPQWWASPAPAAAPARIPRAAAPAVSAPAPLGSANTAADAFNLSTIVIEDEPMPGAPMSELPGTLPAPFIALAPGATPEPPRELSVEELIDLEQQAEFFIVLGQDEAAIELLMSHVRSDGGISPLPYLKLLEIYRRRGDHEAYQRIRERFNRRFNAYAPGWDADMQRGRSLADYPGIIKQLQALWATPVRVMETLDASVFRRNQSDETFDLPAYRELLFLYSIARDLAEHGASVGGADVDLLLPFHDDVNEGPISHLSATTGPGEFQPSDMMTMPLDLDVSFGPAANAPDLETMPAALRRTPEQRLGESEFPNFSLNPPGKPPKPGPSSTNR